MNSILRFPFLALIVAATYVLYLAPVHSPVFGESEVYAADDKPKKKKKRRKRRAKKKVEEEKASYIDPDDPTNVVGADSGFDHSDFEDKAEEIGQGLDAILLLDASRSMQRTDPARLRDQGAKLFLRFLSDEDRVSVIQFAENTSVLTPLTPATPEVQQKLDDSIEAVSTDGNFTDLWSPIVAAMELMRQEGRVNSKKVVILLSDGKMDPHPRTGTAAELTARLRDLDLPAYKEQKIELYTLALSDEADRKLLEEMAKSTNGISWYAPSVNKIHKIFSDLFLTIKRPQVVELEGDGFEVDSSVNEATFYISRENTEQVVTIIDPTGKEFDNTSFPPGVKWYRGDLFDVVTIRNPLPGRWGIKGLETPQGFATLLTELKLEVNWPASHLKIGDSVVMMVRLAENGESISTPGLKGVTFYSYKIINSRTGKIVSQGSLNDKGTHGDAKSGDDIFSDMVKIDKVGEYKALLAVTGPTFSRQQHISFSVSTSEILLEVTPPNEFTGDVGAIRVVVDKKLSSLKKAKVLLVAKPAEAKRAIAIPLNKFKRPDGSYDVPTQMLAAGQYELHARIKGIDPKTRKKVEMQSDVITFESKGATEELVMDESNEDILIEELDLGEEEEEEPESSDLIWGLSSAALSIVWAGGLGFLYYRRKGKDEPGTSAEERAAYEIPTEYLSRIEAIKKQVSETKRELSEAEFLLFAPAAEALGISAPKQAPKQEAESSETEAPSEEEGAEAEEGEQAASETEAIGEEEAISEEVEEGAADEAPASEEVEESEDAADESSEASPDDSAEEVEESDAESEEESDDESEPKE